MQTSDLKVVLKEEFIDGVEAVRFMSELSDLPFYKPSFRICNRTYKPRRKILGYGDPNLEYSFSGNTVYARAWTPLLTKLKELVEVECGCSFNFALLNFYVDGSAKLGHHKDNEYALDTNAPIATLSFGATRTIQFKKPDSEPVNIALKNGSLFTMLPPTNAIFTHAILEDPHLHEPRISITFRKMTSDASRKRPPTDEIPSNDWLDRAIQNDVTMSQASFELTQDCVVSVKEFFLKFYVDLRRYVIHKHLKSPTKEGIMLSAKDFYFFAQNVHGFNFAYTDISRIVGNSLIMMNVNGLCHLQHINIDAYQNLALKPNCMKLTEYEVVIFCEKIHEISDSVLKMYWNTYMGLHFPRRNIENPNMTFSDNEANSAFMIILEKHVDIILKRYFKCQGCVVNSMSQFDHRCMLLNSREKLDTFNKDILLLIDSHCILYVLLLY